MLVFHVVPESLEPFESHHRLSKPLLLRYDIQLFLDVVNHLFNLVELDIAVQASVLRLIVPPTHADLR
jgi:hypothetical protein